MTCWPGYTNITKPDEGTVQASDILSFWFDETTPQSWFTKDPDFDLLIRERFLEIYQAAAAGELFAWRDQAGGRLAEIIILDQFPRNIFRDQPEAFATDALALILAQEAVACGSLDALPTLQQPFLIMPYMHSESVLVHEQAVALFTRPGLEYNLDFEYKHKAIIDRFGRYPHRNAILGRPSTPDEEAFLLEPDSSF